MLRIIHLETVFMATRVFARDCDGGTVTMRSEQAPLTCSGPGWVRP
ncbi:MAG: hypothetical protein ABR925_02160 [Acidimicrobiales bacterium]|jgi:hypothetical protein